MKQFSQENPSHIAELLKAHESHSHSKFQEILLEMTDKASKPLDPIIHIINSNEIPDKAKEGVANFFSTFLSQNDSTYKTDIKREMLVDITNAFYASNLSNHLRRSCHKIWNTLIDSLRKKNPELMKENLVLVKSKFSSTDLKDIESSLQLISFLPSSLGRELKLLPEHFDFLFEDLVVAGNRIVESIIEEIPKNSETFIQELNLERVLKMLEIMELWISAIHEFMYHYMRGSNKFFENAVIVLTTMVQDENLTNTMFRILKLHITTTGDQSRTGLFSASGNQQIDKLQDKIKAQILKYFELAFRLSNKTAFDSDMPFETLDPELNKVLLVLQKEGSKFILESLNVLCPESYLKLKANDEGFGKCLERCLELIKLFIRHIDEDNLLLNKEMLIVNVCFPLLATNKKDLELFQAEDINFLQYHENDSLKSQVVGLLNELCEVQSGILVFIVDFVVALLDFSLTINDQTALLEQYPILLKYKESPIINTWEAKMRVEVCLLALRCLGDNIRPRKDLLEKIDTVLAKHSESLVSKQTDSLLQTRFCQFLENFLTLLTKNNDQLFRQCIAFLVYCIEPQGTHKEIVSHAATEAFCAVNSEKAGLIRILPFYTEIVNELMPQIPQSQNINLFEALAALAPFLIIREPDTVIPLAKLLVEKMHIQFRENGTERKSKLITNKIWNFISEILKKKDQYALFRTELEDILEPLFIGGMIEDWDIDQNIIPFLNTVIKETSSLSPLCWKVLDKLPKALDRYNGDLPPVNTFMAQIVFWGRNEVQNNPEIIQSFITMGLQGLNSQHPDAGPALISHVATLFQTLIEYIDLSEANLIEILNAFYKKLVAQHHERFVYARLGGVFALAFERNFELTQTYFAEQGALEAIIDLLSQAGLFSKHPYDRKAYVVGLTSLLTQDKLNPIIIQKLPDLFNILISFVTYLHQEGQQKASRGQKQMTKISLKELISENKQEDGDSGDEEDDNDDNEEEEEEDDDDDDDDEDEDEDAFDDVAAMYFPTEKSKADVWLKDFMPFRMHIDEFERFREAITNLKKNDSQLFKKLISSLSENKKKLLKDAMKITNVVIDSTKGKTEPRKIIKARNIKTHFE